MNGSWLQYAEKVEGTSQRTCLHDRGDDSDLRVNLPGKVILSSRLAGIKWRLAQRLLILRQFA